MLLLLVLLLFLLLFLQTTSVVGPITRHLHLHYSFPPFSVGEIGKTMSGPNRREVGHGALAAKALAPLLTLQGEGEGEEEFPYIVRVVVDTLGSSGSSSMAAVCSGALALKTAGERAGV
jgi:polyribonucleotide nucleotidyltransferase